MHAAAIAYFFWISTSYIAARCSAERRRCSSPTVAAGVIRVGRLCAWETAAGGGTRAGPNGGGAGGGGGWGGGRERRGGGGWAPAPPRPRPAPPPPPARGGRPPRPPSAPVGRGAGDP